VSVRGMGTSSALPLQLRPIVIPAPSEGVVRSAFASAIEAGPPTQRLPAGAREAWANFRLATQPSSQLPLTVRWYWPDGRRLGDVTKSNRPVISSFLRADPGL